MGRRAQRIGRHARAAAFATAASIAVAAVLGGSALSDNGGPATGPRYPAVVHRGAALPAPATSRPVPLLIALHPSGGSPTGFEAKSGLDAVADAHGFVVAYLSAPTPTAPAWRLVDMPQNLAYIRSEIQQLIKSQNIDPKRVYATGFSAGATMTFFVGCQLSDVVSGIAVISGSMRFSDPCKVSHPVSELHMIGTNEKNIRVEGTAVLLSADAVARKWRALDSCASTSTNGQSGPVTTTLWSSCDDASAVGLNLIQNGSHEWPGPSARNAADRQVDAANLLWSFFEAHPGPASLTVPSATVKSVSAVRGSKRAITATIAVREAKVTARVTYRPVGGSAHTAAFVLARTSKRVSAKLPVSAPGGRYTVAITLTDSYGRTETVKRSITVPKP